MSVMIFGADHLGNIAKNLRHYGIDTIEHLPGRNVGTRRNSAFQGLFPWWLCLPTISTTKRPGMSRSRPRLKECLRYSRSGRGVHWRRNCRKAESWGKLLLSFRNMIFRNIA